MLSTQSYRAGDQPYAASRRAPGSLPYELGDHLYRLVRLAVIFLRRRGERASEGALYSGGRLVEAALLR